MISLLLLLQRHETVTVARAAEELEISPRTVRRDFEALLMAGVPIYSHPGRGGGWRLLGGATTDLSGMHRSEAQALALAAGAALGTGSSETAQAVRKLLQAIPEPFRQAAITLSGRTLVDDERWGGGEATSRPVVLDQVAEAISDNRRITFTYKDRRRSVNPLGLIRKTGKWYLLADADSGRRIFRLDRVAELLTTHEHFDAPADFDVQQAWQSSLAGFRETLTRHRIGGEIISEGEPQIGQVASSLKHAFGSQIQMEDRNFELVAESAVGVARKLIAFGGKVRIHDDEVEAELLKLANGVLATYGTPGSD